MPEQELETLQIKPSDIEKQAIIDFFSKLDLAKLKTVAEAISMFDRAFEGKPLGDEDVITRLINVKNKMETSRFPTYPLLAKQVYLRLIAKYNKQADACKQWADLESEALKAYKGLNWDAYVEMTKAASAPAEQQQFYLGAGAPPIPQVPKRHFWQAKSKQPKEEQSEFRSE